MKFPKPYQNWQPRPFIQFSALLTIAELLALVFWPEFWPWILAVFILDHSALMFAGFWPRCNWIGANWTRLPAAAVQRGEVAITVDDGPDPEVTPAVLDLLDQLQVKASFFCIGARAKAHPELCREIVQRGHSVENHTLRHRHTFSVLSVGAYFAELDAAQTCLTEITGVTPRFFRAPAGLRNPLLDPVLSRLSLTLASWSRRGFDTRETDPDKVLARLLKDLKAGDILLLHDGNAARTQEGQPVMLRVLPPLIEAIRLAGLKPVTLVESLEPDIRS